MPTRHLDKNVCSVCGNPLLVAAGEEGVIGLYLIDEIICKIICIKI